MKHFQYKRRFLISKYAELQVTTNFSFLHSASHPDELISTAADLQLSAIAITDANTLAGVVRAYQAAKKSGIKLIVGACLNLQDAPSLLCFPTDRFSYGQLSRLITLGRRRTQKGKCEIFLKDVFAHSKKQLFISLPPEELDQNYIKHLYLLRKTLNRNVWLAAHCGYRGNDEARLWSLSQISTTTEIPMVATNDICMHVPDRKPLMDVITCIREKCTIDQAGFRLLANAEHHLKSPKEMAKLFRRYPEAIQQTIKIADQCNFSLDKLRYEYPEEKNSTTTTPQEELSRLTWQGSEERYANGLPEKIQERILYELNLIEKLDYAPYFLTVHNIVSYARSKGILCQGRGSAANSAVCYCLGITSIDPNRIDLLFERFISAERNEPPDIDVDFEHERREEIIQYIYEKYGRERAGLTATVIHYRSKMAIREVGKAIGLSKDTISTLASTVWGWKSDVIEQKYLEETGLDPMDKRLSLSMQIARDLIGFPRHLSQHVGGFVITREPLSEIVPISNATMDNRTTIEWDKNDLDALGILKIDILGLGMLTCIKKGFELLYEYYGKKFCLSNVPAEDPNVYDMLCNADSVGVFQVESRAQMTMLPRLKPRNFYDLVIEVAIVRPGPIQGDMVHPYLRRRNGEEKVVYPSKDLKNVLEKTFGVPLFQEQAMKIAIVAGGFSPSEADELRRSMATFRRVGTIRNFQKKLINGMVKNGYNREFARRCFQQIEGFGEYGFPESHAASFALLVYVSAWLKRHYPDVFATAILNSQPMGFYAPAQLVRDAKEHGVDVRPVDVNFSDWDNTLEPDGEGYRALRLGLRQIKGFSKKAANILINARNKPFSGLFDIYLRTCLSTRVLEQLAKADAYQSIGLSRRKALWAIHALPSATLPLFKTDEYRKNPDVYLKPMSAGEEVIHDYAALKLSLKNHPVALLRKILDPNQIIPSNQLRNVKNGTIVSVVGLILVRQRPSTASGTIFITIEDETDVANLIIWPKIFERFRQTIMAAKLVLASGKLQREGKVMHIIIEQLSDLTHYLKNLSNTDFNHTKTLDFPITFYTHKQTTKKKIESDLTNTSLTYDHRLFRSRNFH